MQVQSPRRITLYKPEFLIFRAAGENFVNFCCHAAKFLHFFAKIYEKSQNFGKNMQKYWNNLQKVPNIEINGKMEKYWNILKCIFVQNHNIKKLMVYLGFSRHNISRKKKYISIRIRPLVISSALGPFPNSELFYHKYLKIDSTKWIIFIYSLFSFH